MSISKTILLLTSLLSVAVLNGLSMVSGQSAAPVFTELEVLTPTQRATLTEFKNKASLIVQHDYMKKDIYLVKYLQFNKFNIEKSFAHLKETMEWRKDNKVDELLTNPPEEFVQLQKDYPVFVDGFDKEGRPICESPLGTWPLRKAALSGKPKQVILHMLVNCGERAFEKVRELQAEGKNITQYDFLGNMDGFSLAEQACPACIPLVLGSVTGNEKYFPHLVHGLWLLNTPDTFSTLFRLMRPAMSPATRSAMKVFGSNEAEWKPFLEKRVDFSELSNYYGGQKDRKLA